MARGWQVESDKGMKSSLIRLVTGCISLYPIYSNLFLFVSSSSKKESAMEEYCSRSSFLRAIYNNSKSESHLKFSLPANHLLPSEDVRGSMY